MIYKLKKWAPALFMTLFSLILLLLAPPGTAAVGEPENINENLVVERETGLMWQRDEAGLMVWERAISYCESLKIDGFSKWRIPNVKELRSLINDGRTKPATDLEKYRDVHFSDYWTNTTYVSSSYAYCVNFTTGVAGYCNKSQKKYVRCVKNTKKHPTRRQVSYLPPLSLYPE